MAFRPATGGKRSVQDSARQPAAGAEADSRGLGGVWLDRETHGGDIVVLRSDWSPTLKIRWQYFWPGHRLPSASEILRMP